MQLIINIHWYILHPQLELHLYAAAHDQEGLFNDYQKNAHKTEGWQRWQNKITTSFLGRSHHLFSVVG
ncbi:MAG: hypothetical protein WC001_03345 [Desulfurivibrionaceae bacterium]